MYLQVFFGDLEGFNIPANKFIESTILASFSSYVIALGLTY
jgi:hypothetical protein